jgi:uncharacterized membrane protein YdjX (TVP38/TMEM64 family)
LVLAVILLAIVGVWWLAPGEEFSWEWLQARRAQLRRFVAEWPWGSRAAFFAVFLAISALAVPITPPLAITGGLLFGRWQAILLISFASTAGASVAFLLSRYLLGGLVQRRWRPQLEPIQRGVARDGGWYLLALRLSPLVPFSLINVGMGLTPMRLGTFWWVSQLGMLPISFAFVNAGAQMQQLESPRDILSPGMIIAFTLIGLVPLLLRLGWEWWGRNGQAVDRP